jgi:deazaflavin-dependent oxidoreductase (nitroreductase family)
MAHALTNRLANPVLRPVLRTPLGRRLGRSLAVLRYTGRRTGQPRELVCQYARDGETVWILVGQAASKTWWRNLRNGADVELWLAGAHHRARAVVVEGAERPDEAAEGLTAYLAAVPAAARAAGLDRSRSADDVAAAARGVVLVRIGLVGAGS